MMLPMASSANGLRIAGVLAKRENVKLKISLMGDAVISVVSGQKVPAGYNNAQVMLSNPIKRGLSSGFAAPARMPAEFRKRSLPRAPTVAAWRSWLTGYCGLTRLFRIEYVCPLDNTDG